MAARGRVYARTGRSFSFCRGSLLAETPCGASFVEPVASRVLATISGVGTLEEHAAAAAQAGVPREKAIGALESMVRAKLLQPIGFPEDIAPRPTAHRPPRLRLAMVTADRPGALRQSLKAAAAHAAAFGGNLSIVIIDGSRTARGREANAATTAALRTNTGWKIGHVDAREASRVRARLSAAGGGGRWPLTTWLTLGSFGANRNLATLLLAGRDFVFVDDDVRLEPWALQNRQTGVAVAGHQDLRDVMFCRSRAEALRSLPPARINLLEEHLRLLGRSIHDVVAMAGPPMDLQHACGHMLSELAAETASVVRVTQVGLAGDSGTYCPYPTLFRSKALQNQCGSSRQALQMAVRNREVRRIAKRCIVTHDPHCMAYCTGLANRRLLPPFAPLGRNEDGVFARMLAFADQQALFAHLPYGIIHDSSRPAVYPRDYMPSATQTRVSELIEDVIRIAGSSILVHTPPERLVRLGGLLTDLGGTRPAAFRSLVVDMTLVRVSRRFADLESRLSEDHETSPLVHLAFRRYLAAFRRSVRRPEFFLPIEFQNRASMQAGYRALQAHLRSFGELVQAWPTLWAFAAKQRLDVG